MTKKNLGAIGVIIVVLLLISGGYALKQKMVAVPPASSTATSHPLILTASFYPLAEFAQHVGGSLVSVTNLTPPGAEPHDFDPTPQDLVALQKSHIFVYNGAGLEIWLNKIDPDVKQHLFMVQASQGISLLQSSAGTAMPDPHTWLDPLLASQEVENIKNGLMAADASHATQYQQQAQAYQSELAQLDTTFKNGLATCQRRDLVTSHNAFQYLGKRYGLNVVSISGLSPDEEPTAQKLAEVAQFVKQHQVKYIFFETLVSPKLAQTIAQETGVQTIAFNPLEGLTPDEIAQGKNYLSVQRENLNALRTALGCK